MFHLFHLVRKFPWVFCLAWCLAGVWVLFVGWFCFRLFFFPGNLFSQSIPVVDRPCLALVRQCRKKKYCLRLERFDFSHCYETMTVVVRIFLILVRTGLAKIGIAP